MPKKKWIDKKHSVTFRLVHRSQKDPLIVDDTLGEHVLQPVKTKNREEQIKYGIYYDDDYNYLQHLRSVNELCETGDMERSIVRAPKSKTMLSSTLFETQNVELNVGLLNQAAPQGLQPDLDADVVAALDGDFDFSDPEAQLEDDFVLKANGGELPPQSVPEPQPGRVRKKHDDDDERSDSDDSEFDYNDNYPDSDLEEETKKTSGGMSCAVAHDEGESRLIDDQYERALEEYEGEVGDPFIDDEEEQCYLLEPDSQRMQDLVDEFRNNKTDLVLQDDQFARRYAEIDTEEECEQFEKISIDLPKSKRPKWDCESVLSTYSNIYNHPALIVEPGRKRRLKHALKELEKMDDTVTVVSSRTVASSIRPPNETPEERHLRKKAVKEARAERRIEKKLNKLAFKAEKKKMVKQASEPVVKSVVLI
ncbi:hypothetical protein AB6A40_003313 [Gnathostoma spinigerum]|uniref:Protein LTV1 homolog n=1 Tax=Gnathostoma spinigerum TaxID=75299 RepID=A0ABD6E980_9BILA